MIVLAIYLCAQKLYRAIYRRKRGFYLLRVSSFFRVISRVTTFTPARLTTAQPATVPAVHFCSFENHSNILIAYCPSPVPITLSVLASTEPSGSTIMEAVTGAPTTASNGGFGGRARFTA